MSQEELWLLNEKYHGEKTEEFYADRARLLHGEPLAYIIGYVSFLGTIIALGSRPLIPRTETEFWASRAIEELRSRGELPLRVLDLCAGSGCVGVAVLYHLANTCVDFAEIDACHIPTILENVRRNEIDIARARTIESNLFDGIVDTYDAILTNPPYIDPALDRTESSVKQFEPKNALYGGDGGMFFVREIIRTAPEHLTQNGVLYIEHEPEHAAQIASEAKRGGLCGDAFPDQYGVVRFTRLTRENA